MDCVRNKFVSLVLPILLKNAVYKSIYLLNPVLNHLYSFISYTVNCIALLRQLGNWNVSGQFKEYLNLLRNITYYCIKRIKQA